MCVELFITTGTGRIQVTRTGKEHGTVSNNDLKVLFSRQLEGHVWAPS